MSNTPVRVPQIRSEIAVAIAYLGWSLRQLADYSALIGQPIGEHFLEDALEESWPDFRSKADPVRVENLTRVLGGLGVGLQDDVFGVVPRLYTRMPAAHGIGPVGAVMDWWPTTQRLSCAWRFRILLPGMTPRPLRC